MTAPRAPANRAELKVVVAQSCVDVPWVALTFFERNHALARADIILAAIEARGVRLVPVKATEEMEATMAAFGVMYWRWQEMCAASPYAPEGRR